MSQPVSPTSVYNFVAYAWRQKALLLLADTCQQYGDHKTSEEFWQALPHVLAALGTLIEAAGVNDSGEIGQRAFSEFCKFFHIQETNMEDTRKAYKKAVKDFAELLNPDQEVTV